MAKQRTKIKSYPTPLIGDLLFYEVLDFSLDKWADWDYGDQHYDRQKWPNHKLVSVQPLPDQGDNAYAVFYAADRENEDRYNWEHSKADLSGFKFDTVVRSYIIRRGEYNEVEPKLGTAMPDVPAGKFKSGYVLIARNQDRISERGRRAQESIGGGELDSCYVVEIRTYIDREELVKSRYSDDMGGVLFSRANIYIRGDAYEGTQIEDAVTQGSYWEPTDAGQISEFDQMSDDVWVVTKRDIIPQDLPTGDELFGGKKLRSYSTSINYSWPAVLGDDGTSAGDLGVEIMDWADKGGGSRNYVRPRYQRQAYRGPCLAEIHEEWLTETQLDAANLDVIETLEALPIYYPSPFMMVNIPPTLHPAITFIADTGSSDPTWGVNTNSSRTFPATTYTGSDTEAIDWPASLIADLKVRPFEGGYRVTRVKVFRPYD